VINGTSMIKEYTFPELAKNCRTDMSDLPKYRLAILADCSTQHLATALKGYAYTKGLSLDIFEADYDQVKLQLMDRNSAAYSFDPEAILLYLCTEMLYSFWCETPHNERVVFAETVSQRILGYWNSISSNCKANILQFTFAEYDDLIFGNYACSQHGSFIYQLRKLNLLLMDMSEKNKNVYLVDLCGIQARAGRKNAFDPKLYYLAKMPISLKVLPVVSANVVSVIQSLRGVIYKCVILDLDNTLWGGVIGDDG